MLGMRWEPAAGRNLSSHYVKCAGQNVPFLTLWPVPGYKRSEPTVYLALEEKEGLRRAWLLLGFEGQRS